MNTNLGKKLKKIEKYFFKLMNNGNKEIFNLSQQKEEGIILYQN